MQLLGRLHWMIVSNYSEVVLPEDDLLYLPKVSEYLPRSIRIHMAHIQRRPWVHASTQLFNEETEDQWPLNLGWKQSPKSKGWWDVSLRWCFFWGGKEKRPLLQRFWGRFIYSRLKTLIVAQECQETNALARTSAADWSSIRSCGEFQFHVLHCYLV